MQSNGLSPIRMVHAATAADSNRDGKYKSQSWFSNAHSFWWQFGEGPRVYLTGVLSTILISHPLVDVLHVTVTDAIASGLDYRFFLLGIWLVCWNVVYWNHVYPSEWTYDHNGYKWGFSQPIGWRAIDGKSIGNIWAGPFHVRFQFQF